MPDHEHGHLPPLDPPIEKTPERRLFGVKPLHVVFGALFLVVILLIYLLLLARAGV